MSLFNPFPVGFILKLKLGKKQVVLVMQPANMKTRFRHLQSSVVRLKVASLAMGGVLFGSLHGHALPDLIIWGPAAQPTVVTRAFNSDDCEVSEGCVMAPGVRRLLSFSTEVRNLGPKELFF